MLNIFGMLGSLACVFFLLLPSLLQIHIKYLLYVRYCVR